MKKTEEFVEREKKKSPKQDLKAIYIKDILEEAHYQRKSSRISDIVAELEKLGIIVEGHYVSRILRLLRDEYGMPISGGKGDKYELSYPSAGDTIRITLALETYAYIAIVKKQFGEENCSISGDGITTQYTAEVETKLSHALFCWLFTYYEHITVLGPTEVISAYKTHLKTVFSKY